MAVKIKLKRIGKTRNPQYRIVIADSRTARGGRAIEEIGIYQPRQEPSLIKVDSERAQYWLGVGAQPTDPVLAILKVTGDWQKFKGLPGAEGTLRVAEPKADKQAVFEAAVKSAEEVGKTAKPKAPRLKEELKEAAHDLGEKVEEVKEAVAEKVEEVKEAVAEKVEEVKEAVAEKVEEVEEAVAEKVEEAVAEKVEEAKGDAAEAQPEAAVAAQETPSA